MKYLNFTDTTLAQASQHLHLKAARKNLAIIAYTVAILSVLFLSLPLIAKVI